MKVYCQPGTGEGDYQTGFDELNLTDHFRERSIFKRGNTFIATKS